MRAARAIICAVLVVLLTGSVSAFAEADPVSTSYFVQILAGIIMVLGALYAIYRRRIKRFFKEKFSKDKEHRQE